MPRLLVVTGLYPTPDRPEMGAFVARRVDGLRRAGVDVTVVAPRGYRRSLPIRLVPVLARALTVRGRFDAVEGHVLYPAGLIAWLAARLRRRPVLLYAHGADVLEAAARNRLHRAVARFVGRHADAVVTNSAFMQAALADLGVRADVVPPGVDVDVFRPIDRASARRTLGLDPDARIALYLGALIERKGADVFAEALTRPEAAGWQGEAVGTGPLDGVLRAAGVHLHPPVPPERVPVWLSAADVVVVPSRREPLGMAAVEALACATPVIASDTGGLRETVRDGANGLLVPPGDAAAVARALARLSDPSFAAALRTAGPESVAVHRSDAVAAAMAAIWARLGVRLA